jgi:hypothetical protein
MISWILLLCSVCVTGVFGQSQTLYVYEELPSDPPQPLSVEQHSSFKPQVQAWSSSKADTSTKKIQKVCFSPLVDLLGYHSDGLHYRAGLGLSSLVQLGSKWQMQFSGIQSVNGLDSLFQPQAYFTSSKNNTRLSTDVRLRASFTPNAIFNFQAGLDHHFVGEGSRSLFLGDYGKPYPFGQVKARFWRVEYTVLYQFFREEINNRWKNKYGATHHVSFNAAKWLNFGIFETVVFLPKDTLLNRGYDVEYLNPVIFYRPQEYALGSSDNVLLGASFHASFKQMRLYGQLILDEFFLAEIRAKTGWWANKYGAQLGLKGRFRLGKWNGFYRGEYNVVRPYTYAHLNAGQNYGHQGSVLSHPLGANFRELLVEGKLENERWLLKAFISYSVKGLDKEGYSYGGNVYQPYTFRPFDYGHNIGQGLQNNMLRMVLTGAYKLSRAFNMQAFAECHLRTDSVFDKLSVLPVIGIRSQLWNDYRNY